MAEGLRYSAANLREMRATQAFYDQNASSYFAQTSAIDMSSLYTRFLQHVRPRGRILDAGSGSGRDTVEFVKRGYEVDAFDASGSLCKLSAKLTGIETKHLRFQEFSSSPQYDGIWACASLLHVPEADLSDTIRRLVGALKPEGILYVSFKYGSGERISEDGRFYTDLNEPILRALFKPFPDMKLVDVWISAGEGALADKDQWLNAIARKTLGKPNK